MSNVLRIMLLVALFAALDFTAGFSVLAASSPKERIQRLQKKYLQLWSLEFDFAQLTQTGGRSKPGTGNAVFYRPFTPKTDSAQAAGIMRWNYMAPTEQTIVNDGKELSIYTPQDRQLLITPARDMDADITYAIFTGTKSLLDEFEVEPADELFLLTPPPAGFEALLLIPRQPHPQIKRVQLWLSGDSTIHRLLMEDHFGALTELTFTRVRFNALPQGDAQQAKTLLDLNVAAQTEIIRQ